GLAQIRGGGLLQSSICVSFVARGIITIALTRVLFTASLIYSKDATRKSADVCHDSGGDRPLRKIPSSKRRTACQLLASSRPEDTVSADFSLSAFGCESSSLMPFLKAFMPCATSPIIPEIFPFPKRR